MKHYNITTNFNKCAKTYNDYAFPQQIIANNFLDIIYNSIKKSNLFLEIGCGTGFMTNNILNKLPNSDILATDISKNMIFEFNNNLPNIKTLICDGENISASKITNKYKEYNNIKFDCIFSNLTFQWFKNLNKASEKYYNLLNKDGILAFSTILNSNFPEWQNICNELDIPHYQNIFLSKQDIESSLSDKYTIKFYEDNIAFKFDSGIYFLNHIHKIGASINNDKNINISDLRKSINLLEKKYNSTITYNVLYVIAIKR